MVTGHALRRWWKEYNAAVFAGELPRCTVVAEYTGPGTLGLCWGTRIAVSDALTEKDARETLLHEMVHQWQWEHDLPMDHGPVFKRWARLIRRTTGFVI